MFAMTAPIRELGGAQPDSFEPYTEPIYLKTSQVDGDIIASFILCPLHVLGMSSPPEGVKELHYCFFVTTPSITICSA